MGLGKDIRRRKTNNGCRTMNEAVSLKRDLSIDCVKGLAIMAVVVGHLGFSLPSVPEYKIFLNPFVYSLWYVPVFFCIAGFFIKEEQLFNPVEFIAKKIKTLYLKTILFVGVAVLLHNIFLKIGFYSDQIVYGGKAMFLYSAKDVVVTMLKTIFFAGREPITGALWFAYVLFMALCGYSLLTYFLNKIVKNKQNLFAIKGLVILTSTIASNVLTQNFGIIQNRVSNVFPAMLLIYIGQWFNVEKKMKYESPLFAFLCFLLVASASIRSGGISLNNNKFYDVFHLVVGGGAMTYLLLFLIKKLDLHVKNVLAFIGNYSFAIMGLHLLCFKPCMIIWNRLFNTSFNIAELVPGIGTQYVAGLVFLAFSCFVSAMLGFVVEMTLKYIKHILKTKFATGVVS